MIILGLNNSHTATACLLIDGKIVACISEERLSRIKNDSGLPVRAIKKVLELGEITASQVDYVALGFKDPKINSGFSAINSAVGGQLSNRSLRSSLIQGLLKFKEWIISLNPIMGRIYFLVTELFYILFIHPKLQRELNFKISQELNIPVSRIIKVDHHLAHAYGAYYASPDYDKTDKLILTLDAMGDGKCATVNVVKNGVFKTIAKTSQGNSLGDLYAFVTRYLGMKMGEHEYKVMGLAPYAGSSHYRPIYDRLKKLITVGEDLTFHFKIYSQVIYKKLPEIFAYQRFDNIAAAIQKLTEDLLTEWVSLCIKKTNISNIVCGGGVFMNVKANQLILELPQVKSLFIMPSCGDESTAIGAAYFTYEQLRIKDNSLPKIQSLGNLYLGPDFSDSEIEAVLIKAPKLRFKKVKNISHQVASLLSKGKIVARFSGKMEWGARAMGNRSILSHPSNLDSIRVINEQIKSRDFWMPFAPSILEERSNQYIKNPKKMPSPYMIITFDSTDKAKSQLKAAMHQYDLTLRPQLVSKSWNPDYWQVISEFEKLTGIGGVLNTSFNLHGFPIVCSPEDAIEVLLKSGLEYLAIGNYLVTKN